MHDKVYLNALVVLSLCIGPGVSGADEQSPTVTPARFLGGEKSLKNRIDFPTVEGDFLISIYCFADVGTNGRMSDVVCSYQNESGLVFAKAVERAGKGSRLSPAILNGRKQKIWLQFTVIFLNDSEGAEIQILNNVRENVDKFGTEYIGAQRIGLNAFPIECAQHYDWSALMRITVSADGSPSDFHLDPSSTNMPGGCQDTLRYGMLASRYIPAFYQGKPVDSVYSESWFGHYYFR